GQSVREGELAAGGHRPRKGDAAFKGDAALKGDASSRGLGDAKGEPGSPDPYQGLSFRYGGFELPVGRPPVLIRAFNVLRQYDEAAAWRAWEELCGRLDPSGVLVEGTCDEIGRRAVWVTLGPGGPRTITFAAHLPTLGRPSELAERLPKTLIHRNVPGEPVHGLLAAFDRAWAAAARPVRRSARAARGRYRPRRIGRRSAPRPRWPSGCRSP